MRYKEFLIEKDLVQPTAQSRRAQGLIGPLGSILKGLGGQPEAYVKGWAKWQDKKKKKNVAAAKKLEVQLKTYGEKMSPEDKAKTKEALKKLQRKIHKGGPIKKGVEATSDIDFVTYTFAGKLWVDTKNGTVPPEKARIANKKIQAELNALFK